MSSKWKLAGGNVGREEIAELVRLFERHINRGQVRYLRSGHLDLFETERRGVHFRDPGTGRKLIDCFSSAGSFNVSRRNPELAEFLSQAADSTDMGGFCLMSPARIALAQRLAELSPGNLNRVLFASGGGEAVDAALKLALGATGRREIISTRLAYHGHTGFGLSANGKPHYRHYCEPLMADFHFVPFNDLEAMRAAISARTAAVILEPVQGEAGIFVADADYLRRLRELCDANGTVLIFDEIQTGWGRTGRLFACEHSGVVPDIITLAKSLGGSLYPNAVVLYKEDGPLPRYVDSRPDFHETFSGGSELGCRSALKVIEILTRERLWENAERMGVRLRGALNAIREKNPTIIRAIRGVGLMVGIEYIHEFMGPMMSDALARNGVFAAYSGNAPQVMRFMPPITISDQEMDELIAAIERAVRDMKTLLPLALLAAKIPPVKTLLNSERFQTLLFGVIRSVEDQTTQIRSRIGRGTR